MKGLIISFAMLCVQQVQINQLIDELAADDYRARETASQKLTEIGKPAMLRLRYVAKTTTDPEIRSRSYRIVINWYDVCDSRGLKPSIWQMNWEMRARLEKWTGFKQSSKYYHQQAENLVIWQEAKEAGISWSTHRAIIERTATQIMIVDMIDRQGWSREEVTEFLDKMAKTRKEVAY